MKQSTLKSCERFFLSSIGDFFYFPFFPRQNESSIVALPSIFMFFNAEVYHCFTLVKYTRILHSYLWLHQNLIALNLWGNKLQDVEAVVQEVGRCRNLRALWLNENPLLENRFDLLLFLHVIFSFTKVTIFLSFSLLLQPIYANIYCVRCFWRYFNR